MFTSLTFHNLRCFKDFTLENITPLTLLSGRNNVGKTTILEGVFLLLAYRKADVFLNVTNGIRGAELPAVMPQGHDVWGVLFHDMDMAQELNIAMRDDMGNTRRLTLGKDKQFSFAPLSEPQRIQPSIVFNPESDAVRFSYECGKAPAETGRFFFTQDGLALQLTEPPHLPQSPFAVYLGPNVRPTQQGIAEALGKVEQENKKSQLLLALQCLYEEIDDVFIAPRQGMNSIVARLRTKQSLPIRTMGDGINTLLSYLSIMIAHPGGIFLFDEIETGFHYSFYPKLWELIAKVAQETGSQVFATTHSYECIEASLEGVSKVDRDLFTYVRLEKEDVGIVPYSYANDTLAYAFAHDMEIR